MRLRTLPVSVAGVIAACAYAVIDRGFNLTPAVLCLVFAVLAQIASNFANEYYDYKAGLDAPGREGPRRGVTEGDISPRTMLIATFATLAAACAVGLSLILWSGWWLIPVGVGIALAVLAYSAGPFPLSQHGLGEVAVVAFFGLIPVNFTYFLQTGHWSAAVFCASVAIGLMGANVLIVNNYRDADADRAVAKHTLAVIIGRRLTSLLYLINGWVAVIIMLPVWYVLGSWAWLTPIAFAAIHTVLWYLLSGRRGAALNPMLGITAILLLLYAVGLLAAAISHFA